MKPPRRNSLDDEGDPLFKGVEWDKLDVVDRTHKKINILKAAGWTNAGFDRRTFEPLLRGPQTNDRYFNVVQERFQDTNH